MTTISNANPSDIICGFQENALCAATGVVFNTDLSATSTVAGAIGLNTAAMQDGNAAAYTNWGAPWVFIPGQYPMLGGFVADQLAP
ncbi:MAG: hypothetical protein GY822_32225 [Deltaproteobacteria bacterium]|nr:hypothetical protein [Deltaproteobacteria bacterium]